MEKGALGAHRPGGLLGSRNRRRVWDSVPVKRNVATVTTSEWSPASLKRTHSHSSSTSGSKSSVTMLWSVCFPVHAPDPV